MDNIIASTYEIIDRIGTGGGGVVYLANHIRLNKKVVLKADKRTLSTRPEILRREVDALKNLSHTYIPQVYDFFVENDTVYTVMDYIEGESLDKPLKRGEGFSQAEVIAWTYQLLEALCYLHNPVHGIPPRGIVHSDIKPANIMRTPRGNICLIDFNIALALGEENVIGRSPGYASPEHYGLDFSSDTSITSQTTDIMDDPDATLTMNISVSGSTSKKTIIPDARSDIYSLGATMYHLLSGVRPASKALEVKPLSNKEYSPLIVKMITKAMNPNPDLRYQTAREMLDDLINLRKNDPRIKRLKRTTAAVSAILSIAIIGGAFMSFTGLKRMEMTQKSLALAEYSQNSLESGDPVSAMKIALEALPQQNSIFVPGYSAQAKKALADASGVYDLSDGFKSHSVVELPSETLKVKLSPDGKKGVGVHAFETVVFDAETGDVTAVLPTAKSALSDVIFTDNKTLIYAGESGLSAYDTETNQILWTGKPATQIAVSADGSTIAGVYRNENYATVYDANGNEKAVVSFGEHKQKVVENDTFADPEDNILALNSDGQYLAASFDGGGLMIYDTGNQDNSVEIYDASEFNHFEGGFSGQFFAFSSTKEGSSVFAVINMTELVQEGGFELDSRIGVNADETGIYISNKDTIVKIDPITGEQTEVAYADSDVRSFDTDTLNTIVATEKNDYIFYDNAAELISQNSMGQTQCSFVDIAGDYAVCSGMDTPVIRVFKRENHKDADIFSYDSSYSHDEARISENGLYVTLFNYKGFRLFGRDGNLINDVLIPEPEKVYDQQYSKSSGNLIVLYNDALRIYSGDSGAPLLEEIGLKSVFYAPYGISILGQDGVLRLIDRDTGSELYSEVVTGNFAAYCGMVVDDEFLNGGELIGASKCGDEYVFAVKNGDVCSIYNGNGEKLFEAPVLDQSEAFFTKKAVIFSPLHGTPTVYSLDDGTKIADLERDSYLTYITEIDNYVMSEYVSASGDRYGILLDMQSFEPLASLPALTDIMNGEPVFDYHKGKLRATSLKSTDELIEYAKSVAEQK